MTIPNSKFKLLARTCILGVCAMALATGHAAGAPDAPAVAPPVQPGFPVSLSGSYALESSPALSDLDGNGTQEIIFGGRALNGDGSLGCQGRVYAYNSNGSLRWQATVPADVNSTAATYDLNGDGVRDVVIGLGSWMDTPANNCAGGVVALNGVNGSRLWLFPTAGAPDNGVQSSVAIADLDADGVPDVVFGAWDQCIYRLNGRTGTSLWGALPAYNNGGQCNGRGFWVQDTVWSSPALADLDGNGALEIVIGTDITAGGSLGYPSGGILWVLAPSGTILARRHFAQAIYSSPAVADLDRDGKPEIIVGSGPYFPKVGNYLVVAHYDPAIPAATDRLVVDWQPATVGLQFASPAIGDLNGDGYPDVVITTFNGTVQYAPPMYVQAFDYKHRVGIFTRQLCDAEGYASLYTFGSPLIADVSTATPGPEVIVGYQPDVMILNRDGTYHTSTTAACYGGNPPTTNQVIRTGRMFNTPAVGDIDNNGTVEIVATGASRNSNPNAGSLYAWTGFVNGRRDWPRMRDNQVQDGVYDNMPPRNPGGISATPAPGTAWIAPRTITIRWTTRGSDYGRGLIGYSATWTHIASTMLDTSIELGPKAMGFSGVLGNGEWYAHVRAVDRQGNGANATLHIGPFRFDGMRPTSMASSPAQVSGAAILVRWSGSDWGAGIASYTIQVKQGDAGAWSNWLTNVPAVMQTGYYGSLVRGQTYHFRSIARDGAGNIETAYTGSGDTATTVQP